MKNAKVPGLKPIKSSMASHATYDPLKQALHVQFHNGQVFRYDGVAPNIGETLMGAQSFGSQFNRHVAGKIKGSKL